MILHQLETQARLFAAQAVTALSLLTRRDVDGCLDALDAAVLDMRELARTLRNARSTIKRLVIERNKRREAERVENVPVLCAADTWRDK